MFDGSFCLTGDSLLKILAILYRIKCKIPVILLGECGCGKTVCYTFHILSLLYCMYVNTYAN